MNSRLPEGSDHDRIGFIKIHHHGYVNTELGERPGSIQCGHFGAADQQAGNKQSCTLHAFQSIAC